MLSKYAYFEPTKKTIPRTDAIKPKNLSIIGQIYYFFLYSIRYVFLAIVRFTKLRQTPTIAGEPSIQELTKKFVEKRTAEFLKQYDTVKNPNQNIEPIFYTKKEYLELSVLESNEIENRWKTRILFKNTPRGNIVMFYNVFKLGFSYYCDENMPYDILNAVAMQYVIMNQCRDFFMDEEITPVPSPLLKLVEDDKKPANEEDDNKKKEKENLKNMLKSAPFAKLKNYKIETANDKPSVEKTDELKKKDPNLIERNRFLYQGKMRLFPLLKKPEVKKKNNLFEKETTMSKGLFENSSVQNQVFSYRDYKKNFK